MPTYRHQWNEVSTGKSLANNSPTTIKSNLATPISTHVIWWIVLLANLKRLNIYIRKRIKESSLVVLRRTPYTDPNTQENYPTHKAYPDRKWSCRNSNLPSHDATNQVECSCSTQDDTCNMGNTHESVRNNKKHQKCISVPVFCKRKYAKWASFPLYLKTPLISL